MYCYRCGQRLADTAKHCPNCGAAIFYNENGPLNGAGGGDCDACADESFGAAYSLHDPNKTSTDGSSYGAETHYTYDPQTGSYREGTSGSNPYGGSSYHYGSDPASGYQNGSGGYTYRQDGGQPVYPSYPPAPTKEDGFALTALICAIASLLCCCVPYIGVPAGLGAVVFGIMGLKAPQRKTMAIIALVLGGIMLIVNIAMLVMTLYYQAHPELIQEWMDQMSEIIGESIEFPVQ